MHERGVLSPATDEAVREAYDDLGAAAQEVVRGTAKAMSFDREEYRERVTGEVVATARDALFASLLRVTVGSREEWTEWRDAHPEYEPVVEGSEHVDSVAWHAAPVADTVLAATFQNEPDAAVATLRRLAFGRVYRERL